MQTNYVEISRFELNDNRISVCSESTQYVNAFNISDELLSLRKKQKSLVVLAKSKNINVKKNDISKAIEECESMGLVNFVEQYKSLFNELKRAWEIKLINGIVMPTCDDKELSYLSKLANDLEKLHYRSTPIGRAREVLAWLKEAEQLIVSNDGESGSKVTIYL